MYEEEAPDCRKPPDATKTMNANKIERRRALAKAWRQRPRRCECEEFMGTRPISGGKWICDRCFKVEESIRHSALRRAHRAVDTALKYIEPYRLHATV